MICCQAPPLWRRVYLLNKIEFLEGRIFLSTPSFCIRTSYATSSCIGGTCTERHAIKFEHVRIAISRRTARPYLISEMWRMRQWRGTPLLDGPAAVPSTGSRVPMSCRVRVNNCTSTRARSCIPKCICTYRLATTVRVRPMRVNGRPSYSCACPSLPHLLLGAPMINSYFSLVIG
jgi:hypothetical protein